MNVRSRWFTLGISAAVIASFVMTGVATPASAANPAHQAAAHNAKHASASGTHCKKRNSPKGNVKVSDWQFPDTMNPAQSGLAVTSEINDGVFDSLFFFNNHAKLTPDIASKVPTVKNGGILQGGKEFIVHLRPYAKWSNGKEITSKDVKFGWDIGMDTQSGPSCSGTCDIISRIDTPNATTVVFHLKQTDGAFLTNDLEYVPLWPTSWTGAWSNDPHAAANKLYQDTSYNFETPGYPTSGPYYVTTFVNNDRVVAQPMKYYETLSCGAYFKQILFVFYATKAALIAAAASKQTDTTTNYTLADTTSLQSHAGPYKLSIAPAYSFEHLELNQDATYGGKPNPLHKVQVRQAISLGLDRIGLIRSAFGASTAVAKAQVGFTWLVNTAHFHQPYTDKKITGQWDPIAKKYMFNTGTGKAEADAKKLLAQAGYPGGGFSLDWVTTSGNPVRAAQEAVFAQNMHNLGISVNPSFLPASKMFGTWDANGIIDHGQFQIGDWGYIESLPDPAGWITNMASKYIDRDQTVHAPINSNDSGIRDPAIDHAFKIANHSVLPAVRQKYYNIIQQHISNNADWIILYYRPAIGTTDGTIKHWSVSPLAYPEWNMYQWAQAKGF